MIAYIAVDALLILFYLLTARRKEEVSEQQKKKINLFLILCFAVLFFISAFRGDFTMDYVGYEDIYNRYLNFSLSDIFTGRVSSYPEIGYVIFQYIVKTLFGNPLFIFVFSTILILVSHMNEINRNFPSHLLPLIIFVEMGNYYTSFNVMRQIMAVSIVIWSIRYIEQRKFIKYVIVIMIAATFHTSAIFMLPMYFLLNLRFGKAGVLVVIGGTAVVMIFLPQIVTLISKFYWDWYDIEGLLSSGYSYKNVVGPAFLSLVPIIKHLCSSKKEDDRRNIWLNGTYIYLALSILGLRVAMVSRIAMFFSIFATLAFTQAIYDIREKLSDSQKRSIFTIGVIGLVLLYGFVVKEGSGYDPYYFIWQR